MDIYKAKERYEKSLQSWKDNGSFKEILNKINEAVCSSPPLKFIKIDTEELGLREECEEIIKELEKRGFQVDVETFVAGRSAGHKGQTVMLGKNYTRFKVSGWVKV